MSLRKTSCRSCVTAKRRCDLGLPSCSRCRKKSIACHYPYPFPQAKDDQTPLPPLPEGHRGSSRVISSTNSATRALAPVEDWIEQSMIADQEDDFLNLMCLPEGPVTSGRAWDFFQGTSGWLPFPSSADTFTSALPRLERRVLEFWPRVHDRETWGFCTRKFLSYIDIFLDTGVMPLIEPVVDRESDLSPLLREAYGVCAAYRTCKYAKKPFYHQLLDAGVNNVSLGNSTHTDLHEQLDRVQALVLYYILFLAGAINDKPLFGQLEHLLAQSTADLEHTELASRQIPRDKARLSSPLTESYLNDWVLCESARRLVVISYLVRAVHSVVQFQRCDFIKYLAGLPVSTKSYAELCWEGSIFERQQNSAQSDLGLISYDEFVRDWKQGDVSNMDEFRHLLLVACKGLGSVQERTSMEPILTF